MTPLMPRMLRRQAQPPEPRSEQPRPTRPPTAGQLRRERRALVRAREERIRDLGGIVLEMYKRDRFNDELVTEQCGELTTLEDRLREIDSLLAQAASRRAPSGRCECGAPVYWGTHFCPNCGRPVGEAPVVTCVRCDAPLPAEAAFCARCGTPTGEPTEQAAAYEPAPGSAPPEAPAETP